MELRNLCCSTSSTTKTIQLGRSINLDRPLRVTSGTPGSSRSRWRSLWKKLMREKSKMKIFDCSAVHAVKVHVPGYDPYTYAQNFDQGLMLNDDEPDCLARSFSMRFAAPNRLITSGIQRSVSDVGHDHDVICVVF